MGILDILKPQPRWKHADPAVRLEALKDLDDATELAVLAESDSDARIRRAAVGRVADPGVLGRLATSDADQEVRDRAADRLMAIACRSDNQPHSPAPGASSSSSFPASTLSNPSAANDGIALTAVRALVDPRRLSTIVKSDAPEAVRADALARITDERALSSIARHAKHEVTARAAMARLTSEPELLEVALHADHRDVAVGAFDRLAETADAAQLRHIETRSQQKAVSRKARTMIQAIENEEAARRAAAEERGRREVSLCQGVEQIAELSTDVAMARAELDRLSDAWRAMDVSDEAGRERFDRAVATAEAAIVKRQRDADEVADRRRLRAEAVATGEALCGRVETLDGDDVIEQLTPIEEEWRSHLPLVGNGPEADRLAERFAQAVTACRKRHEMGALLAETRVALDALAAEAEALSFEGHDATATARWQTLNREARGLTAALAQASRPADDIVARFAVVEEKFAAKAAEREAADEKTRQELIRHIQRLSERAKHAAEADTITLREGDRLMKDIAAGLDSGALHAASQDVEDALGQLRTLRDQVGPRVRELREMDDWRRFANAQRQEQLIAMAEAIVVSLKQEAESGTASDLAATARALRELHAKWREVADAPRGTAQRLWDRFRTATDFIRSRCESYFAKMREEREGQLEKKTAIIAEAEALASSSDFGKAAARFQELQTEWQATGPAAREAGRELALRFRAACNVFFGRRREDLIERKKTWSENAARKDALCERAEILAASTDWDAASAEMKRLQADWKTIGPVRRSKSEAVWNRFRSAADKFFERYHHRHEINLAGKLAEREAWVLELEGIAGTDVDALPEDLAERVQQIRTTWNRSVPIPSPAMKPLGDRWHTALAHIVSVKPEAFRDTDLDPSATLRKMDKIISRLESFQSELNDPADKLSPTELLAARLRSALANNAMGGRASEDAKWRAASDAVKDAQAAWERLAPVSGPEAQELGKRFREACRKINEQTRRHSQQHPSTPPRHDAAPQQPQLHRDRGEQFSRNERRPGKPEPAAV